jgi:hypothetical protein
MALPNPRSVFGVHAYTPYSRSTGEFYGTLRVIGSSSLALSGELVKLNGGSNRYPWDIQDGLITAELSLTIREYPDFVFELFLGKAPTTTNSGTSGAVSTLTNVKGTSLLQASTGIATVAAKSGETADLKFGKYIVKVVTSTTVDVYASTDIDFQRGVDKDFVNGTLKITASALTITTATAVEIPDFGLELTGGSGTIGMTVGDTAEFYVEPIFDSKTSVVVGATSDVFPEHGAIIIAQAKGDGQMMDVEAYRVKALGLPLGFDEKAFSETEVTAECFYDSAKNAVLRIRHVDPT